MFHKRVAYLSESPTKHQRNAYATTLRNATTVFYSIYNRIVLIRSVAIIYILYFYLARARVVPNLTTTAVAPLCAHPLRRRLAILTTTTLLYSNYVRYLTNY